MDRVPRLESVYFGGDQYPRLAAVLERSARAHNPAWAINVRRIPPHALRAASGSVSHGDNHYKLGEWRRIVSDAPDGSRILLVDADTFVTAPLDPLWDMPFDVAYTARPEACRFPLNAGVIAVRVGNAVRRFLDLWVAQDAEFLSKPDLHQPWRKRFGGINQASFGALLHSGIVSDLGLDIAALSCLEWNCEDASWSHFDPAVTRIVHVKSGLRMAVFNTAAVTRATRRLAQMWREIEVAAELSAAVAS